MQDTKESTWREFSFVTPADWEMLQFSRRLAVGSCAFADRYQFRFELDWRVLAAAPDMERLMTDYRAKLTGDGTLKDPALVELPGWQGLAGRQNGGWTTRYGRFFATASCLVEAVVICPDGRDKGLERALVTSIVHEGPRHGLQPVRAFGMAVMAPSSCMMDECTVQPAHAALRFSNRKLHEELLCQRSGMLAHWLTVPIGQWLAAQRPSDAAQIGQEHEKVGGHDVLRMRGERKRSGLFKPRRLYSAAAWTCPHDGRLYHGGYTVGSAAERDAARPRLSCCAACEVTL